jgi:Na+/melibiose symporter-like transporter
LGRLQVRHKSIETTSRPGDAMERKREREKRIFHFMIFALNCSFFPCFILMHGEGLKKKKKWDKTHNAELEIDFDCAISFSRWLVIIIFPLCVLLSASLNAGFPVYFTACGASDGHPAKEMYS